MEAPRETAPLRLAPENGRLAFTSSASLICTASSSTVGTGVNAY